MKYYGVFIKFKDRVKIGTSYLSSVSVERLCLSVMDSRGIRKRFSTSIPKPVTAEPAGQAGPGVQLAEYLSFPKWLSLAAGHTVH